jgi:hypothetical protein
MTKIFKQDSIIPIDGGYVVVDKEAKKGDYFYNIVNECVYGPAMDYELLNNIDFKVIASIGIRIEGVPLIEEPLPDIHVFEVYNPKAGEKANSRIHVCTFIDEQDAINFCKPYTHLEILPNWIKGTNNQKQYTEADVRKAFKAGARAKSMLSSVTNSWDKAFINFEESYIKSLQKVPISVELEYEYNNIASSMKGGKQGWQFKITNTETNTITPIKIEYNDIHTT